MVSSFILLTITYLVIGYLLMPKQYLCIDDHRLGLGYRFAIGLSIAYMLGVVCLMFNFGLRTSLVLIIIVSIFLNFRSLCYLAHSTHSFHLLEWLVPSAQFLRLCIYILLSSLVPIVNLARGELYLVNMGPDFEGHVFSSYSLGLHDSLQYFFKIFTDHISPNVWINKSHWNITPFIDSVSIEFLLRSNRLYHAVLPNIASVIDGLTPSIPNSSISLLSLTSLSLALSAFMADRFIFYYTGRNQLAYAVPTFLLISPLTVLMIHEGITGQLLSSPFYLIIFIKITSWLSPQISPAYILPKYSSTHAPGSNHPAFDPGDLFIVNTLLFCTALTAQAEGLILLVIYIIAFLLVQLFTLNPGSIKANLLFLQRSTERRVVFRWPTLLKILTSIIIILPFLYQYFHWFYYRLSQDFSGGSLSLDWDPLLLALNILPTLNPLTPASQLFNIGGAYIMLTLFSVYTIQIKRHKIHVNILLNIIFSFSLAILLVFTQGHKYANFKVCMQYSWLMIAYGSIYLSQNYFPLKPFKKFTHKIIVLSLCLVLALQASLAIFISIRYIKVSDNISPSDFFLPFPKSLVESYDSNIYIFFQQIHSRQFPKITDTATRSIITKKNYVNLTPDWNILQPNIPNTSTPIFINYIKRVGTSFSPQPFAPPVAIPIELKRYQMPDGSLDRDSLKMALDSLSPH
jgi:hypothetical protein